MKNIFSKTTENRTQNGVKSYSFPTRLLSPILIFAFLTLGVGQMWGAWTGNAGICVNGTWYKASDHIDGGNWLENKTTINGTNLGAITSLALGGQYENYDNKQNDECGWNNNNGIWITITTNSGTQINNFKLSCYRAGKSGDNNVWKTTGTIGNCGDGSSWATYSVNISDYAAGVYKLKVHWLSASGVALPSSGDDVATFTINPVVTFHANGGTGDDYTQTVTYNSATALTANTFSKTGYTFLGWSTTADGDVVYTDVASVTLTAHTDLYAKWAKQSLTITSPPTYLSTTKKLELDISYENIPEGYCFRVHELRTGGYYPSEAYGEHNRISGTGSTTYTSSAYLPEGADRIVVELWKINPFEKQAVSSNEVAVTVEREWKVDVKAKTDGLISTAGGTVSHASVSPTAHIDQTITAAANVGYDFTGWTANTVDITFGNASEPSTTVYAKANGEVYANFKKQSDNKPVLGAVTATPSGQPNYARPPIDFELSVTSTYLAHPVVVFLVNDGTTTYEVVGAPYGAEGNSAVGTIGADAANTTVHKATFTATEAKTYTVSAKLYEGLLVENFETANYTTWVAVNGGSSSIEPNLSVSANNGSPKVRQITPNGTDWHTSLTSSTGKWVNGYQYIHTKMYYTAGGELRFKISDAPVVELAVAHGTNNQWNKVVFNNSGKANINFMFPWIVSNTSTFYIDDIILSNEASMTMLAETAPASFSIKSEITGITFSPGNIVAPSATVSVTATVELIPVEQTTICWRVLYSNDNPLAPQPTFKPANAQGNSVSFIAPEARGSYKVEATLRKGNGNGCGGEEMHTFTAPFQVAGDHTVTVQYKCGNTTIKASTSATGKPLDWTPITAPEIVGYSFLKWVEGDGITIEGATNGEKADATINFKAIYDGKLTAVYTKKQMIYFNNTLGWSDVYVYFYENNKYWGYGSDTGKGTGSNPSWRSKDNSSCPFKHKGAMTQIEGTNIWYYDCEANSVTSYTHVAFNEKNQENYDYFYDTKVVRRGDYHSSLPMFVPLAGQTPVTLNTSADYYNEGYWMCYPNYSGYTLKVYNTEDRNKEPTAIKSFDFPYSDGYVLPMSVDVDLEANKKYYFDVYRNDNTLFGNNGDMKYGNSGPWSFFNTDTRRAGITTTAAGNYRFTWSFFKASSTYNYHMTVTYPVAPNDYRVIYTDNATWTKAHTARTWIHPSRIIRAKENAVDTISFFVSKGHSPEFKIQQVVSIDEGTGAITWKDFTDWISCDDVDASGVYNFIITQYAYNRIGCTKIEMYTGNYYIRTDAANSKWDNYRSDPDHLMTYSEYSKDHSDYTHYFVKFVREGTNVKFVVANDYSPCISDTLIRQTYRGGDNDHVDENGFLNGDLPGDGVNVRFMWDIRNNAVYRAYLAPAQSDGSNFLVLRGTDSDNLKDENGNPLRNASNSGQDGYNHKAPDHCIQFVDNENWIYETTVQVVPSSYVKLYAYFHGDNFYYKGTEDDTFADAHAIKLVEGSGDAVKVRVIYDFKTDRLVAAYLPSGNIDEEMAINADVMFIREHQGDIDQLTFSEKDSKMGSITNIKTAYAVMRFNKWTLNNKEKTGSHTPLASPASIYERSLYYVSFPFPVNLSEVFGFGTYGQHWIIQRYRGDLRAQQGFWAESAGFWEFIWNRNGVVLQPNEGYILTLETELLGEESDVWGPDQRSNQIELFFPSTGPLGSITNASVTQELPKHTCTIDKTKDQFGNPTGLQDSSDPSTSYNRTVFDSHWNIMSVPTYVNVDNPNFANTTWIGGENGNVGPKFLYTWNMNDNTLTATSGKGFMYHAMHAYTVQYYGDVTWKTSVTQTAAPQRNTEYRGEYEFCLEVQQDEQMIDRTYVRLSDDENVTTGFEFSEDMTKQFNSRKANIFTIAGNTSLGGNSLPLSTTQTTVVPVGVKIKTAGDYTFSIPEGTEGIGVTLVDNETGVRTSLSALEYTVNLAAGTHDQRFVLEISPIQNTPTGIEEPTSDSSLKGRAQKRIIDGVLYIVKDGKIFDARGTRVE